MSRILAVMVIFGFMSGAVVAQTSPEVSTSQSAQTPGTASAEPPARATSSYDPLLDLPPVPGKNVSLVGGTVVRVDPIRDHVLVRPFGGKTMPLAYDVRTQFYRDGVASSSQNLQPGDRVYADTVLDGTRIFAKAIRVQTATSAGDGHGQVISYDDSTQTLILRDELSSRPVAFHVAQDTAIRRDNQNGTTADLQPGTLVAIQFVAAGNKDRASEISILAMPGSDFVFSGPVTHLDLSSHLLAVANRSDSKLYDIAFEPALFDLSQLHEGSDVTVTAKFDGTHYAASAITVNQPPAR